MSRPLLCLQPRLSWLIAGLSLLLADPASAQLANLSTIHVPREGDYVARDFRFHSGETLPQLRLHYLSFGKPVRDAAGRTSNAVLILHGTGGSGRQFLQKQFADVLFGPGQP